MGNNMQGPFASEGIEKEEESDEQLLPEKKRRKFEVFQNDKEVCQNDKKEENSGIGGFEKKLKGVRDSLDLEQDSHKELYKKTLLLCSGILRDSGVNESVKLKNYAKLEQIKLESQGILNNGKNKFTEDFVLEKEENSGIKDFEEKLKRVKEDLDLEQDSHKELYKKTLLLCVDVLRDSGESVDAKLQQIKLESQVILNNGQSEFTGESLNKTENVGEKVIKKIKTKRSAIKHIDLVKGGHCKEVYDDGKVVGYICSYCNEEFKKSDNLRKHLEGRFQNGGFVLGFFDHGVDINKKFNEQDFSKLKNLKKSLMPVSNISK
jgi:hypothetical protein